MNVAVVQLASWKPDVSSAEAVQPTVSAALFKHFVSQPSITTHVSQSSAVPIAICASPDGLLCAVLFSGLLDIRKGSLCLCLLPLPVDVFPKRQQLAWCADSSLIAVSFSNGSLLVYSLLSGSCLCDIQTGTRLHTNPDDMIMSSLFIQPHSVLLFHDLQDCNRQMASNSDEPLCRSIWLFSVSYNGLITAFKFNLDPLDLVLCLYASFSDIYSTVSTAIFVDCRFLTAGKSRTLSESKDFDHLVYWDVDFLDNILTFSNASSKIQFTRNPPQSAYTLKNAFCFVNSLCSQYGIFNSNVDLVGATQINYCRYYSALIVLDSNGQLRLYSSTELKLKWSSVDAALPLGSVCSVQCFDGKYILACSENRQLWKVSINSLLIDETSSENEPPIIPLDMFSDALAEISTPADAHSISYILASNACFDTVDLVCLIKVTPEEKILSLMGLSTPENIAELCSHSSITTDQVYKTLWVHSPEKSPDLVFSFLSKVQDLAFVFLQGLDSYEDLSLTRTLLQHVIERTDMIGLSNVEAELNKVLDSYSGASTIENTPTNDWGGLSATDVCVARIRALKYLDRLNTFEAIYLDDADPKDFIAFRDADLVMLACKFSSSQQFDALEILFTRHGHDILQYRTSLLDLIPECTDPKLYQHLLPRIDRTTLFETPWPVIRWRKADWSSNKATKELLELLIHDDHSINQSVQIGLQPNTYPASAETLVEWYLSRIITIEEYSGLIQYSIDFAKCAVVRGVPDAKKLLDRLAILGALQTQPTRTNSSTALSEQSLLTLSHVMRMEIPDLAMLVLEQSSEQSIVQEMEVLIKPILGLEHSFNSDWMIRGLAKLSNLHPRATLAVIQSSSLDVLYENRMISSPIALADVLLIACHEFFSSKCIFAYKEMLAVIVSVLHSVPHSPTQENADDTVAQRLASLEHLNTRLECLRFLAKLDMSMSISDVQNLESSENGQLQLVEKIPRRALSCDFISESKRDRETNLYNILNQALQLQALGIFKYISQDAIYSSFLSAAVSNGLYSFVKMILPSTNSNTTNAASVQLVQQVLVSTAREMFDNAHLGSKSTGLLKEAWDCLNLVTPSVEMKRELELIDAVDVIVGKHHLVDEKTRSELLPIQIRLHPDRVDLLRQLLSENPQLNAFPEMIMDLACKLCGETAAANTITQLRVRSYLAHAAIDDGSLDVASYYCNQLIKMSFTEGPSTQSKNSPLTNDALVKSLCNVFQRLAESSWLNLQFDEKLHLISCIIQICPITTLDSIIGLWRKTEFESILWDSMPKDTQHKQPSHSTTGKIIPLFGGGPFIASNPVDTPDFDELFKNLADNLPANPFEHRVDKLSQHDFYSAPGCTPSDNYSLTHQMSSFSSLSSNKLYNDIYCMLRCQEIRRSQKHNTSNLLGTYANLVCESDTLQALAALFSCNSMVDMQAFFNRFEPSDSIGQVAAHFFALSALYKLNGHTGTSNDLWHAKYTEIMLFLTQRTSDTNHISIEHQDQAEQLLSLSKLYSFQAEHARNRAVTDMLALRYHVNLEDMDNDLEYRRSIFSNLCFTIDAAQLEDCLEAARYFNFDTIEILNQHITWLISSNEVNAIQLSAQLQCISAFWENSSNDVCNILLSTHAKYFILPNDALIVIYRELVELLGVKKENTTKDIQQLYSRIALLETIQSSAILCDLTLPSLRSAMMDGAKGFVCLWKTHSNFERFDALLVLLTRLDSLYPCPLFSDEMGTADIHIDQSAISSNLFFVFLDASLADMIIKWELMNSESVMSLVSYVHKGIKVMQPSHVFEIGSQLVVGELASRLMLDIRKSTLDLLRNYLAETSFVEALYPLEMHMSILLALSHIDTELHLPGGIFTTFILEIDCAYRDVEKITTALFSLVRSEIDGQTVERVVNAIQLGFVETQSTWSMPYLYKQAAIQYLELIDSNSSDNDPQLLLFEKWIDFVLKDCSTKPLASVSGWDDDEFDDLDISNSQDDIKHELEVVLDSAVQGHYQLSKPGYITCHKLLEKHFEIKQDRAVAASVAIQNANILASWGLVVQSDQLLTSEARIDYVSVLLEKTSTDEQYICLFNLLVDWTVTDQLSETFNSQTVEHMWMKVFRHLVSTGRDKLLFFIMLHLRQVLVFDDKDLLQSIQDQRDLASFYQFSLISFNLETVSKALQEFKDMLIASKDFEELLFVNPTLLLLVLAYDRGERDAWVIEHVINWTKLCETILSTSPGDIRISEARHQTLVISLIADLCIKERFFHASRLAQLYLGVDDFALHSVGSHISLITKTLTLIEHSSQASHSLILQPITQLSDVGTRSSNLLDHWKQFGHDAPILEKCTPLSSVSDNISVPLFHEQIQRALDLIRLRFSQ
ncbi:hypothetical protein QVD99_000536 [Batrachochytrium dendrobatidis]|nr:hypothetical protein QVD99_000536 [Batrachochytrium dendrobatidis]